MQEVSKQSLQSVVLVIEFEVSQTEFVSLNFVIKLRGFFQKLIEQKL